jgi:hypothetical protein
MTTLSAEVFGAALIPKDEQTGESGYLTYAKAAESDTKLQALDDLCNRIVDSVDPTGRADGFNLTTGFGAKREIEIEVRFDGANFTIMPADFVRVTGSTKLTRSSIVKTTFDAIRQVVDEAERRALGPAIRKSHLADATA